MTYDERLESAATRPDAGYGLVGVIVALVLLSVGVLSVTNVLTQSIAMQTIASQRTVALSIARTTMEDIRSMDPTAVAPQGLVTVDELGNADLNGAFTREVTVTDAGSNLIEVTVIVDAPRSNPIQLVTWIYYGAL